MKNLVVAFLLLTSIVSAQNKNEVDLKSPYHTIHTHLYYLQEDTFDIQKSASVINNVSEEKAEKIVLQIKQILDGKGLRVSMGKLPKDENYIDTLSTSDEVNKYVLFPNQLPEIYVEKMNGNWYYSRETVSKINKIYRTIYPAETEYLKNMIPSVGHKKVLNIELWQLLGIALLVILATLLYFILNKIIFKIFRVLEGYMVHFSHNSLRESLLNLSRPVALLLVFYIFERYVPILQFSLTVNSFLFNALEIARIFIWIYIFLQFVQVLMDVYAAYSEKTESKLDDQLVPILKKLLRGLVIFGGILKMVTILGADVATVIAGASIGGLAVALASQDTVKNLIGTFMIFLDQPFQIGDWIEGGGVEGTVEEVGFRSTRIRAADTSIFTIPNSKLSEIVINNKGLRLYRRYNTTLGIRYDTPPELIEAFVKGVREIVVAHPETRSESYNVEFNGFGDSALQILLNVYFLSTAWDVEQSSKHRLHIAIVKLAKGLGVEFAFPSQTVMIEQFPGKQTLDLKYNTDETHTQKVISEVVSGM